MRVVPIIMVGFALLSGAAQAQTYVLSYTGKSLTVTKNSLPIPGATNITLSYRLPASYMPDPGGCANYNSAQGVVPSAYSDGADTLATLAAQGFGLTSRIYFCLDSTGTKIVSWLFGMSGANGDRNPYDYYQIESQHDYLSYPNVKDSVELAIDLPDGTYYGDSAPIGRWKIRIVK